MGTPNRAGNLSICDCSESIRSKPTSIDHHSRDRIHAVPKWLYRLTCREPQLLSGMNGRVATTRMFRGASWVPTQLQLSNHLRNASCRIFSKVSCPKKYSVPVHSNVSIVRS